MKSTILAGRLSVMSNDCAHENSPTFEAALERLQAIVHELEEGELGLEASLGRFEDGISLLRACYRLLEQAEQRIEILTGTDGEGNPITAPFDATSTMDGDEKSPRKSGR